MMPWFIWNNIDSRTMGVWVSQLPPIIRAAERVQEVEIPGRAGTLTIKEGENVHDGYVKECIITAPWNADFHAILDWLVGDGEVIFSNEPDRMYWAHLAGEIKFDRISNTLKQCTIPFYVHPHKGQWPREADIAVNGSATLYNPGSVEAEPMFTLTFTGAATLTVNGETMLLNHLHTAEEETVIVDSSAEFVTSDNNLWSGNVEGEFPRLKVGSNEVSCATAVVDWAESPTYTEDHLRAHEGDIYMSNITARAWVSTKAYVAGDYCTYNDNLYVAVRATSSTWTAADWTLVGGATEWIPSLWTLVTSTAVGLTIKPRWRWF